MKCDIIIPIWNQLEFTKECIESLVKNTNYPYRLILIDNASSDETKHYLEDIAKDSALDVKLIRNEENLGFVKAVNQGLKVSDSPYVCTLNNDTIPAPHWLERMIDFAKDHKDAGLINPQCNGHGEVPIEIYAKTLEKKRGAFMEMNQCQGFCMLIKREVIDEIGFLDESFGIGGFDDTDYSMRVHLAGYRCVAIADAYVYHRLHASFAKSGDREDWVKRNREIYYAKWGKHLRIGLIFSVSDLDEKMVARAVLFAYGLAREWSWVHIWINFRGDKRLAREKIDEALKANGLAPHQNIRMDIFHLLDVPFNLLLAAKLVERMRGRMRHKRFDGLVVASHSGRGLLPRVARGLRIPVVRISFDEEGGDWEARGRQAARVIKAKRDEYAASVV